MSPESIKIYGERNTGTHYLASLIERNFRVKQMAGTQPLRRRDLLAATKSLSGTLKTFAWELLIDAEMDAVEGSDFGWKHGAPCVAAIRSQEARARATLFLILTKNPLFWFQSMYRKPYHCLIPSCGDISFSEFLRAPWVCMRKDNLPGVVQPSIVGLWNAKHDAYRSFFSQPWGILHVRYEDLLLDFDATMAKIAASGLIRKRADFINVTKSTKGGQGSYADHQRRYSDNSMYDGYDTDDIEFVKANIDHSLAEQFGYSLG